MNNKNDVPGWMTDVEIDTLISIMYNAISPTNEVFNRPVLEIGSFLGRSAVAMSDYAPGRIICVDPWDSTVNDFPKGAVEALDGDTQFLNKHESIYSLFLINIRDCSNIFPIRMSSREFHWVMAGSDVPPGLIFIDGDHSVPGVAFDLNASLPGGQFGADEHTIIAGHDYGHPYIPHIKPMVDEFARANGYTLHVGPNQGSVFWMQK